MHDGLSRKQRGLRLKPNPAVLIVLKPQSVIAPPVLIERLAWPAGKGPDAASCDKASGVAR
ncbi:hypothetical protein LMTR13_05470 [Bradyrhizobium icense]|uniref:Uncharacterized protein n=1 Tax=Bradyrhizobium icense TaxID=1274631 RepID=A0A1B1UAA5_9BRAD|nr:hypothetical protein LMTR13_05470 [Bradyrhizobium icense]